MNGRILVVERSRSLRRSFTSLLRESGYRVTFAGDGVQALVALHSDVWDAIVCEQELPHLSGIEILEKARAHAPDTQRFLASDAPDMALVLEAINRAEVHGFLRRDHEDEVLLALELACERAVMSRRHRWMLAMGRELTRRSRALEGHSRTEGRRW